MLAVFAILVQAFLPVLHSHREAVLDFGATPGLTCISASSGGSTHAVDCASCPVCQVAGSLSRHLILPDSGNAASPDQPLVGLVRISGESTHRFAAKRPHGPRGPPALG